MIRRKNCICSAVSIALSSAIIFAVLSYHPIAEDALWTLLVAVAAALSLHLLRLCSSISFNPHEQDEK
jgi:hypothetical protein